MYSPLESLLLSSLTACFKSPLHGELGKNTFKILLNHYYLIASVLSYFSYQRLVFVFFPSGPDFISPLRGLHHAYFMRHCPVIQYSLSFSQIQSGVSSQEQHLLSLTKYFCYNCPSTSIFIFVEGK